MRMSTVVSVFTAGILVAFAASEGRAQAQAGTRATAPVSDRGWIGISFEVMRDRRGHPVDVVINDVNGDSPAGRAGLRAGDRVLAINELRRPEDLEFLNERLAIRPGDRVVVEVERDSDRHHFSLRAASLPAGYAVGRSIEWTLQSDSMVDSWVRAMDSLRIELVTDGARSSRIRGTASTDAETLTLYAPRPPLRMSGAETPASPRFQFFVFGNEPQDSMRQELTELDRMTETLQLRMEARERDLRGIVRARGVSVESDREVADLRVSLETVAARSSELRAAIAGTRSGTGFEERRLAPDPWTEPKWGPAAPAPEYTPLTPYMLGSNRVAGANVVDLKPELARYFKVDGGILVIDVAPGTPAALGGIVPGDVITHVDQVAVRTVDDVRLRVSLSGDRLPITLVREGAPRQVLLRR